MKTITLYQGQDGFSISYDPVTNTLECKHKWNDNRAAIKLCYDDLMRLGEGMGKLGNALNRHAKGIARGNLMLAEAGCEMRRPICELKNHKVEITYSYTTGLVEFVEIYYRSYIRGNYIRMKISNDSLITLGKVMCAVGSALKGGTEQ